MHLSSRHCPHLLTETWSERVIAHSSMCAAQHPPRGRRNESEEQAFKRALRVMGDVYASAVGTTVLQLKEIPPRDADRFDGALCLFGLKAEKDEAAVLQVFHQFGEVKCDLTLQPPVVRFTTHAAALEALAAHMSWSCLCEGVDTQYNERAYDTRGWCATTQALTLRSPACVQATTLAR